MIQYFTPSSVIIIISTRSERFATRGTSHSASSTIFRNNGGEYDTDPCSEIGAFRHALWQATITSYYGHDIATEVGNAHEDNPSTNIRCLNGLDFNGFNRSEQSQYRAKCEQANQAIYDAAIMLTINIDTQ